MLARLLLLTRLALRVFGQAAKPAWLWGTVSPPATRRLGRGLVGVVLVHDAISNPSSITAGWPEVAFLHVPLIIRHTIKRGRFRATRRQALGLKGAKAQLEEFWIAKAQ
jgi:hypothetical protein